MAKTEDSDLFAYDTEAQPTDQRTLTVCHVNESYDIYGGRHNHGRQMGEVNPPTKGWLGNPYRVSDYGREKCIELFEEAFIDQLRDNRVFCNAVAALPGTRVACHCRHQNETEPACHLDVVREALLDGRVFRVAHSIHGIPLTEIEKSRMCDPEVFL